MDNTLDLLLGGRELPKPEASYKIARLSKELGGDIVFRLRALAYDDVADIKKRESDEMGVHIILEGTVSPNLKDKALLEHYKAITPVELIKKMLLPGEIEDLSRAIEMLSGFRKATISEIKKN